MKKYLVPFMLMSFMLGGCAETELASHWWKLGSDTKKIETAHSVPAQQGSFKVGKPYQITGQWYTPRESYSYDETGIASWYGDDFHGKKTANGEIFNKNALTAAHPTLQMPSLVRVTNLETGRSAVLRVNDRGPFSKSRLIDVSHHSANVLGFERQGTARVRVQVLERESRLLAEAARQGHPPHIQMAMAFRRPNDTDNLQNVEVANLGNAPLPPVSNPSVTSQALPAPVNVTQGELDDLNKQLFKKYPVSPTSIYVQVGAFSNQANANALRTKLAPLGQVNIYETTVNGQLFYRVRLGPVANVPQADALLRKALNAGHSASRIVVD